MINGDVASVSAQNREELVKKGKPKEDQEVVVLGPASKNTKSHDAV
jgi:hypothetical protein